MCVHRKLIQLNFLKILMNSQKKTLFEKYKIAD